MKLIVALCTIVLTGCVNTSSPEFIKKSEQACAGYGFKAGSDQMANCKMNLALVQEQDNMRRKQNMARAMSEMGDNMQRQADRNAYMAANMRYSTMPTIQTQRTVYCSSRRGLGTIETTCR